MRRLFALILLALSLAVTSGPAFAVPKADCPTDAPHQVQGDHEDRDCCAVTCASECATLCPGAVVPSIDRALTPAEPAGEQLAIRPAAIPPSADLSGIDPPPRTTFS